MEPINTHPRDGMKTIKIYRFGTDEDYWNLLVDLYDHEGLLDDDWWHCFWEDDYIELRVSTLWEIPGVLDERGIQYDISDYTDDHPAVVISWYDFLALFHDISVLHMNTYKAGGWLNERQVRSTADRIVHAFFNMGWGSLADLNKNYYEGMLEATILTNMSRNRAFHAGVRHMYKQQK